MKLGVMLNAGDSLACMDKSGQLIRFKKYYLERYSRNFEEVYIFSYKNERLSDLPKNVYLVPNKYGLHRYIYGLILPFVNYRVIKRCDIFRVFHLSGTMPAIITKLIFHKPFVFNFAYDYKAFARLDHNIIAGLLFKIVGQYGFPQ